ncbi:hypothetical protein QTO34_006186 [Cnephaeus nilssonii]|uniref:Uncharacterized protein n=1 Tax=Cnephaeus nilssonii TaxID=3371016 RepID=A0AA40HM92_CNENI|nr:hypothetical protein QTO34_006186 [Eptesicus nilssonii]
MEPLYTRLLSYLLNKSNVAYALSMLDKFKKSSTIIALSLSLCWSHGAGFKGGIGSQTFVKINREAITGPPEGKIGKMAEDLVVTCDWIKLHRSVGPNLKQLLSHLLEEKGVIPPDVPAVLGGTLTHWLKTASDDQSGLTGSLNIILTDVIFTTDYMADSAKLQPLSTTMIMPIPEFKELSHTVPSKSLHWRGPPDLACNRPTQDALLEYGNTWGKIHGAQPANLQLCKSETGAWERTGLAVPGLPRSCEGLRNLLEA